MASARFFCSCCLGLLLAGRVVMAGPATSPAPDPEMRSFRQALAAGNYAIAVKEGERILQALVRRHGERSPALVPLLNNLGSACHRLGDQVRAIRYFRAALELAGNEPHPRAASIRNNIGCAYYLQGDLQAALIWYDRALAVGRRVLPAGHPSLATYACNLALVKAQGGALSFAVSLYREALAIRRQSLGEAHPLTEEAAAAIARLETGTSAAGGVPRKR